jgi:hypothetical protein
MRSAERSPVLLPRPPRRSFGSQSGNLILLHQPAKADDIGSQNSGKAALCAFFGHVLELPFRKSQKTRLYGRPVGESITPDFRLGSNSADRAGLAISPFTPIADVPSGHGWAGLCHMRTK